MARYAVGLLYSKGYFDRIRPVVSSPPFLHRFRYSTVARASFFFDSQTTELLHVCISPLRG